MSQINHVEFFAILAAAGKKANKADSIDRNHVEFWHLADGRVVARQIGTFGCASAYFVGRA